MRQVSNFSDLKFIRHGFFNATDSNTVTQPILMNQVHSADVAFLTEAPMEPLAVDALITQTPNLNLTVKTADCAPILLVDPSTHMIAAVHAGWRGAFQGIIETTVLEMLRHGANLDTIRAGIGPHIQQKSFEIGSETKALFPMTEHHFFIKNQDRDYFDFDAYVRHRLKRAGISNIESTGEDTVSDLSYNSFRRNQTPDRQFSSIMIAEAL